MKIKKLKEYLIAALFAIIILMFLIPFINAIIKPELTYMQIYLKFGWWVNLIQISLGVIILLIEYKTKKND